MRRIEKQNLQHSSLGIGSETSQLRVAPEFDKGGPFDQLVWRACSQIPRGSVVSYKDLALSIGKPKAYRAVAQALGRNPYAPVVPCHRVVSSSGLGGFSGRGGLASKRRLLFEEQKKG